MNEDRPNPALLTRKKIRELVQQIDPNEKLEPDVELVLLDLADEFIQSATRASCALARHRNSDTLDVKDVQLHLESAYNIRIPGFGGVAGVQQQQGGAGGGDDSGVTASTKPGRRPNAPATAHQSRLNQVKKAMASDLAEKERTRNR